MHTRAYGILWTSQALFWVLLLYFKVAEEDARHQKPKWAFAIYRNVKKWMGR